MMINLSKINELGLVIKIEINQNISKIFADFKNNLLFENFN